MFSLHSYSMVTEVLRNCQAATVRHHHHVQLALASCLYVLTLLALCSLPEHTLDAFHQLHRLATCIAVASPSERLPILGPLRIEHADAQTIHGIVERTFKFLQDHSLQEAGEPWVKAVGTVALRQVRSPDLHTSAYAGQHCNWTAQDTEDRGMHASLVPPAWKHSPVAGLPIMQASWCPVPDGGYYLGLRLRDMASHELCDAVPAAQLSQCVNELLSLIKEELDNGGWIDHLSSTVTLALTLFDFRHGLACSLAVVGEKPTATRWNVSLRLTLVYPRGWGLMAGTLVVLVLVTVCDVLCAQCIRLRKRMVVAALDAAILLAISLRLAAHVSEARLLQSATDKFLKEINKQPRRSDAEPYGLHEDLEALVQVESRISTLETLWMLAVLLKLLSLEWYGTRDATIFFLMLRRALRKSYCALLTIALIIVVHALAFYRFFGTHLTEFEFFDSAFSTVAGYAVGILNHEVFFLKNSTWKVLFLISTFTLVVLGSEYVVTLFLSTFEALTEVSDAEAREGSSEGFHGGEELDDKIFLRIVKEELEMVLPGGGLLASAVTPMQPAGLREVSAASL